MVFVILLFVVLIYEWRNGALDFGPDGGKILKAYKNVIAKSKTKENIEKSMRAPVKTVKPKEEKETLIS
jgi:NADH-quinone oxidoreductase subunit A